jgi:sulfate transport system ATP-binding protein
MGISIRNIRKTFGDFNALADVSLDIRSGELVALLGPSGSGKTTLLRIIAGLETPDSGSIFLKGRDSLECSVRERNVGFMFQHYALFKHMTVFDNVAFGLRVRDKHRRPSKSVIHDKVLELLRLVHLEGLHERYPSQLSGGQKQRVALARALAIEPSVLLLDEPFGALDAKVRKELRRFMRHLHETIHVTTVFVTHDQEEAMEVADRVVVMSNGAIEQLGTPNEVWNEPTNGFVYDFLGNYNEFEGWKDEDGTVHLTEYDVVEVAPPEAESSGLQQDAKWWQSPMAGRIWRKIAPGLGQPAIPTDDDRLEPQRVKLRSGAGTPVKLYARPHELYVVREANGHNEYISARILHINAAGPLVKMELERKNGNLLQAELPASVLRTQNLAKGMDVLVRPKQTRIFE